MPAIRASAEMLAGADVLNHPDRLLSMPKDVRRDYIRMLLWLATGFDSADPYWRTAATLHTLLRRGLVELLVWPNGFMAVRNAPGITFDTYQSRMVH
jgi:hypothetical protein